MIPFEPIRLQRLAVTVASPTAKSALMVPAVTHV